MPVDGGAAEFAWLIEAPGQNYLCARYLGGPEFFWSHDHNRAIRFYSKAQAEDTMAAIRELAPSLFAFAATLGDARAVEHGWMVSQAEATNA